MIDPESTVVEPVFVLELEEIVELELVLVLEAELLAAVLEFVGVVVFEAGVVWFYAWVEGFGGIGKQVEVGVWAKRGVQYSGGFKYEHPVVIWGARLLDERGYCAK